MELDPQELPNAQELKEPQGIRLLGGPRHNKKIADDGSDRFVWNNHLYLRTRLTLFGGGVQLSEWAFLYFGVEVEAENLSESENNSNILE